MTDVFSIASLSAPWQVHIKSIAKLFAGLPVTGHKSVLVMLFDQQAQAAVYAAIAELGWEAIVIPADCTPSGVEQVIAQTRPAVAVCLPEVFGWVSKLAFLGKCLAIYTCGENGEGTLLDRASHHWEPCSKAPLAVRLPRLLRFNPQGLLASEGAAAQ